MIAKLQELYLKYYKNNILLYRFTNIFSVDILVKSSGIILLPVYLKLMTQDEYGLFQYFASIIVIFGLVFNFGLYIAQSKLFHDYADEHQKGTFLFTINVTLFVLLFSTLSIIYFGGYDFVVIDFLFEHTINYANYRDIIFLGVIVSIYSHILHNYFLTSEKIKLAQAFNLLKLFLINAVVIYLLYFLNEDAVKIRLKYLYIMELLLILFLIYFYFKAMKLPFKISLAIKSLKIGFPITLSAILGVFINFSDKFFLEKYGNFKDLSVYFLAFSIASIIPLISKSFQNIWQPLFFKEKNINENIRKTNKAVRVMFLSCLVLAVFLMIVTKSMLVLNIIEMKYNSVIYVLPLVLLTQIAVAITPLFSNYLVYFEATHLVVYTGAFICVVSIALNTWLVPQFNIYGAALAAFIANSGYLLIYYYLVRFYSKKLSTNEPN